VQTKFKLLIPAAALAVAVVSACAPPPPPPPPPPPTTSKPVPPPPAVCPTPATNTRLGPDSESPISSWGVDGAAYTTVTIGNVVYVGGLFHNAISPSGARVPRSNLAAFCVANGALVTGFVANFDASVYALTTDG